MVAQLEHAKARFGPCAAQVSPRLVQDHGAGSANRDPILARRSPDRPRDVREPVLPENASHGVEVLIAHLQDGAEFFAEQRGCGIAALSPNRPRRRSGPRTPSRPA